MPRSATGLGAKTWPGAVRAWAGAATASAASAAAAKARVKLDMAPTLVAAALEPQQSDERLCVGLRRDRAVEVVQRPADDLDPLVLVGVRRRVGEIGGME